MKRTDSAFAMENLTGGWEVAKSKSESRKQISYILVNVHLETENQAHSNMAARVIPVY